MKSSLFKGAKSVQWNILDIIIILFFSLASCLVVLALCDLLGLSESKQSKIYMTVAPVINIAFVYWWLKRKSISLKDIGLSLSEGKLKVPILVAICLGSAYSLTMYALFPSPFPISGFDRLDRSDRILSIILFPVSLGGVGRVVIGPLFEEIFFRGLVYGRLRSNIGYIAGLIIQATAFALLHQFPQYSSFRFLNAILVGLFLGVLYEWSENLYPSIVCHATLNYLSVILRLRV
jgi:membrane protease YdiL (CAAX protease family)